MNRETAERIILENSKEQFGKGYVAPNTRGVLTNYTGGQLKLLRDLEQSGAPLTRAIIFKVMKLSRLNPKNKALIERYSRNIDEDYYTRKYPDEFKPSEVPPLDKLLNEVTWWKLTDEQKRTLLGWRGNKEWRVAAGIDLLPEEEEEEEEELENPVVPQAPVVQEEIQEPQPVPIEEAVPLQEQVAPANAIAQNVQERNAIIDQIAAQEANERQAQDEQAREAARIERNRLTAELQRLRQVNLDIIRNLNQTLARRQEQLRQNQRRGDARGIAELLQQIDQLEEERRQLINARAERERARVQEDRERLQQLRNQLVRNQNPNQNINEIQNRNQEIQAAQGAMDANIAQIENEVPRVRAFDQLVDDLNEVYLREGYSPDEQRELNNILQNRPEQEILDFIAFARGRGPVDYRDFENREGYVPPIQAPPAQVLIENPDPLIEPEDIFFDAIEPEEPAAQVAEDPGDIFPDEIIGPEAVAAIQNGAQVDEPMIAADNVAQEPQGLEQEQAPGLEPEPEPEQGPAVPGQVPGPAIGSGTPDKLQYKKRYHETSLKLFFQNSSVPNWDPVLESNIMSLDIPKREIVEMMEQVISEYGPVIHVTKRKSSTLEELNELVQLQFCVMRNLHMGPRTRTATVKLSDLENLQRVAAGGAPVMNGANAAQPIEVRVPQESDTPLVQTKEEFNFYKNYDRVQHLKSLGDYVRQVNRNPFIKTKNDAKTLGLIKGNNFQSVADYAKRGPHRLKPLSTFVRKNKS